MIVLVTTSIQEVCSGRVNAEYVFYALFYALFCDWLTWTLKSSSDFVDVLDRFDLVSRESRRSSRALTLHLRIYYQGSVRRRKRKEFRDYLSCSFADSSTSLWHPQKNRQTCSRIFSFFARYLSDMRSVSRRRAVLEFLTVESLNDHHHSLNIHDSGSDLNLSRRERDSS